MTLRIHVIYCPADGDPPFATFVRVPNIDQARLTAMLGADNYRPPIDQVEIVSEDGVAGETWIRRDGVWTMDPDWTWTVGPFGVWRVGRSP